MHGTVFILPMGNEVSHRWLYTSMVILFDIVLRLAVMMPKTDNRMLIIFTLTYGLGIYIILRLSRHTFTQHTHIHRTIRWNSRAIFLLEHDHSAVCYSERAKRNVFNFSSILISFFLLLLPLPLLFFTRHDSATCMAQSLLCTGNL